MIRSFDPVPFNTIANDPSCKPFMGSPFDDFDYSPKVDNINNFCFLTDNQDGGYVVENIGNGHYIAHTMALPSARGKAMAQLMADGFQFLFTATDCVEIHTSVADGNKRVMLWSELAGFRKMFHRDNCFPAVSGLVGETFMTKTFDDWVLSAPGLKEEGEAFHNFLELKSIHANHPDDEVHDRYVGATIIGCRAGNTLKAVSLYNIWARSCRYVAATILSISPCALNIGTAIISLNNGSLEILKVFDGEK